MQMFKWTLSFYSSTSCKKNNYFKTYESEKCNKCLCNASVNLKDNTNFF